MAILNQMADFQALTDGQWQAIEPLFPKPIKRGRGKPHTPWREVVNTILYVHLTGSKWANVPKGPAWSSKSAAHRWLKIWQQSGFLAQILALYEEAPKVSLEEAEFPLEIFAPALTQDSELIVAT